MAKTNNFSLFRLRKALGLTQSKMGQAMGLSLRHYQELEAETRELRPRHVRLAESVALDVAIEKGEPELAPASVRNKAMQLARAILMQNFRQKAGKLADIILAPE